MSDYRLSFVIDDMAGQDFPAKLGALNLAVRWLNIQRIRFRAKRFGKVLVLSRLWKKLDVLIDISGYSQSDVPFWNQQY